MPRHDKDINIRLPDKLHHALELERQRISRRAGAEVKTSAVVRAILEKALKIRRTDAAVA